MAVERISPVVMLPARPLGPGDGHAAAAAALPALEVLAQAAGAELAGLEAAVRPERADGSSSGSASSSAAAADALPDAMRLDQAALRQVAWSVPDTAQLALAWRATLLRAVEARTPLPDASRVTQDAPAAPRAEPGEPGAPATRPALPAAASLPGWLNVYAWGGMQAMLGLSAIDADDEPPPRRRAPVMVLRFALDVPGLGRVVAHLHLAAGGLMLDLAAETPALMQHLRDSLPGVAAAVARAELRLVRCRLIDVAGLAAQARMAAGLPASLALPPALFRAATALWSVLAPPLAAVSPPSR
jgi:hypothetical protein